MLKKDKLDILYEDKDLIAINKVSGLLTIATEQEKEKTLYHKLLTFMKQKNKNNKIFIVNRIDKDTSGIVLFAKSMHVKSLLQDNWDSLVKLRRYVAVVKGKPEKDHDEIRSWLKETKTLLTYSSYKKGDGKLAITIYDKIDESNNYTLLDIKLKTGRKNQIRVHMKDIDHPVVGDKKYGYGPSPLKRLGLHAKTLIFVHPITKKEIIIDTDTPKEFLRLIKFDKK